MLKVPVAVIGKIIRRDTSFVRYAMQKGLLPIGVAVKRKRWSYMIVPQKVCNYFGISMQELEVLCNDFYVKRDCYNEKYRSKIQ